MKKNTKTLIMALGGVVLFSKLAKARPANIRGIDPGFDWEGQHIQGGQGSAITNVGSPVKTDYVLVANAMKNYALNTWGLAGPQVPKLPMSYAVKVVRYWYEEAARVLGLASSLVLVSIDPFNKDRGFSRLKSPLNGPSFTGVYDAYTQLYEQLPAGVVNTFELQRVFGAAPPNLYLTTEQAATFWDAIQRAGIGFDVSKGTPTSDTVWTAGLKAAKDAIVGAPGKAVEVATDVGKGAAGALFKNPITVLLLGGLGYLAYTRWARR